MSKRMRLFLVATLALTVSLFLGYRFIKNQFSSAPDNQLRFKASGEPVSFVWGSAGHSTSKQQILLPITLAGLPDTLYMLLDFGIPNTILYQQPIDSLSARLGSITQESGKRGKVINNFIVKIGNTQVTAQIAPILPIDQPFDWQQKHKIIGAFGTDLLEYHAAIMDFPRQLLVLTKEIPAMLQQTAQFHAFQFSGRRILLPGNLNEESATFMYDSGAEDFQLSTNQSTFNRLKTGTEYQSTIQSWGYNITTTTAPTQASLSLAGTALPLTQISYLEWPKLTQRMLIRMANMEGMVSNQPFKESILVLDAPKGQFAVISNQPSAGNL